MKLTFTQTGIAGYEAANRRIDLSRLPAIHNDRSNKGAGIFLILFSLIWGGVPAAIIISSLSRGEFDPAMFFLFLFPAIGLGLLLFGLWLITRTQTIRIDAANVSRESRSIFGYNYWTEPLHRYRGIRSRSEYRSGGKNSSSYTLYIVELFHDDKKKRITLYESRSDAGFRKIWEDYCRQLNKPALEGEGAAMITRSVEDLDKSVRELAREGKLDVTFDPKQSPPDGFNVKVDRDLLHILLPKPGNIGPGIIIALLFPAVFIYIGFGISDAPTAFGFIGILILLLIMGALIWNRISQPVLLLGRDKVHYFHQTPWGNTAGKMLDAIEIETVRIGRIRDRNERDGVLLITDDTTLKIADGLPQDALKWLNDCILAVITR